MYTNLFDSHTHTAHSKDGKESCIANALSGLEKGLVGMAVTDHCEFDTWEKDNYARRIAGSVRDALEARERFRGRLEVAVGVEVGQQWANPQLADRELAKHEWDFIIGSVHRIDQWPDLYTCDYRALGERELERMMNAYYDHMEELVRWGNFDVLGHITFPLRSAKRNSGVDIDRAFYQDRVEQILRQIIGAGKGIELNTSSLRGPLRDTMPPLPVLQLYHSLGGEIVTIGSDAHCAADVGEGIQQALEMLEYAGLRYFSFFRRRDPVMLRIF